MAELIDCTTRSSESLAKRLLLAYAGSKGYGVTSVTANATISQLSAPIQILTPDADRNVTFEADVEVDGSVFLIFNNAASASGYDLTIKNAAASTLATVNPQNGVLLLHNGTAWTAFGLAGPTGTLSLAALAIDTIAEKTSGSGVTVDGCLVKDGRAAALATAAMTTSAEQTGTGAPQTVAHAIGATPSMFWVSWTEIPVGGCSSTSVSVDATNVTLTVTSGAKFRIHALK